MGALVLWQKPDKHYLPTLDLAEGMDSDRTVITVVEKISSDRVVVLDIPARWPWEV